MQRRQEEFEAEQRRKREEHLRTVEMIRAATKRTNFEQLVGGKTRALHLLKAYGFSQVKGYKDLPRTAKETTVKAALEELKKNWPQGDNS